MNRITGTKNLPRNEEKGGHRSFLPELFKFARRAAFVGAMTAAIAAATPIDNVAHTVAQVQHEVSMHHAAAPVQHEVSMHHAAKHHESAKVTLHRAFANRQERRRIGIFIYFNDFDTRNGGISFGKALAKVSSAGFNIILPETITSKGFANYRNGLVAQNPQVFNRVGKGRDPMRELIESARAHNVSVWPWMPLFVSNYELEREHPEWFAESAYGRHSNFLDFLNAHARKYQLEVIMHFVQKYNIQGINLDIELPIDHISYSQADKSRFVAENGLPSDISWPGDVLQSGRYHELWLQWTNRKLLNFLGEVHREIKRHNPNIVVSYDTTRNPNVSNYYSQWTSWARTADVIDPMIYWKDSGFGVGDVGNIARRDVRLTQKNSNHTQVTSIVGGSLDATKGMSAGEWERGVKGAMRNDSNGVFVFAYVCVDQSNAWGDLHRAFRGK